jgi:hypothetical protein
VTWISAFARRLSIIRARTPDRPRSRRKRPPRSGRTEPLYALQLPANVRLATTELDHRTEDVADADAGAGARRDRRRGRGRVALPASSRPRGRGDDCASMSSSSLVLRLDRRADVDGRQGGEDERLDGDDDDDSKR